jgi:hypothetical protein
MPGRLGKDLPETHRSAGVRAKILPKTRLVFPMYFTKKPSRPPPYATRGTVGLITSFETTPVGSVIAALPGGQRACWDTAVLTERLVVREWLFL